MLRYTATVIEYAPTVSGQAKIFSGCEDLKDGTVYIMQRF